MQPELFKPEARPTKAAIIPTTATSRTMSLWERGTYVPEPQHTPVRPGALDYKNLPSRGFGADPRDEGQ